MRTRLLAALAVLAAALLAPAAALAAPPAPILSQPTTPTAAASIPLAWIDVAGEDGYHVYRAEADCSGEVDISTVTTVGADQTTFSDLSPAEGTHCYFVRAYDIGGESPDSNHVLVTYDTQPPSGSVTAPAFGSTISTHSQSVPITLRSADAADGDGSGVASVEYFAKPLLGSFASVGAPATSPPYDFAWLPADGTYDLKAIITDNLGHTFETAVVSGVVVDGTPPAVTLSGVTDNAKVKGSLPLTAVAADGQTSVQSVAFEYRQGSSGPFTTIGSPDTTAPYGPVSFDTVALGLANGSYEVHALATDLAGNSVADAATNVLVDNTAPTVTLSGVSTSAEVHGSLSLSATAADVGGSGLQSVAFEYRQGSSGPFTTIGLADTTAPYGPVTFDTVLLGLANGTYEIHALATDGSGNTLADTATNVLLDNTAPTVTLSGAATNAKVRGSLSLSASAGDTGGSGVQSVAFGYRLGSSGPFTPIGFPDTSAPYGPVAFDTTAVSDGTYQIQALASDGAGNTLADTATNVLVDNTQPAVTLSGVATNAKVGGSLSLSASASDVGGSGVQSVAFSYRLGSSGPFTPIGSPDTTAPYGPVAFDTTGVGDGIYQIQALATDVVGNALADVATNVLVDNTQPTVTLSGVATNAKVGGSLSLSASALDTGGSGVQSVAFSYRLGSTGPFTAIGSPDTTAPYGPVAFVTTGVGDGTYQIQALATDVAGNTRTDVATNVLIDNTQPAVTLSGVATNAKVRGSLALSASASDVGGSGVQSVAFSYRLGSTGPFTAIGSPDTTAPYGPVAFDTTGVGDGIYQIQALATDAAGNAHSDVVTNVLVDNTQPTVVVGGVATNDVVRGTVQLSATAADTGGSGVATVQFGRRTNGSSGAFTDIGSPLTTEPFAVSFDTTSVSDGSYEIGALATDVAGNAKQSSSVTNVLIDNHAPLTPSTPTGLSPVSAAPTITFGGTTDPAFNGVQSGVDHYDVYRGGVKVNVAAIAHTGAGPYSWSDVAGQSTAPASGTQTYSYTVKAVDVAGNVSVASPPHVIVLDPTAVSAPTSVAALATPTSQRPQLTWVAPAAPPFTVDHYDVYRDAALVLHTTGAVTTFTDGTPSLADGTYTYQVVAAASDGTTVGVASGAVAIVYDTTPPAAPGGITATAAVDGSVGIGWATASDGTGSGIARYVVRRALSSTPPASATEGDAICQGLTTSCTDAAALNGRLYSYAVFAVDRAGNTSLAGNSPAVTARDQLPPAVPQGLAATPGDGTVGLRWAAAGPDDDVAGYVLVAKQGGQAPTSDTDGTRVCTAIVAGSTSCAADGLTNGATYTFALFALDEALNRSQPAVVSSVPNGKVSDLKGPAAVSKLKATVSGHKVTLTWKNPVDRDFDHVEVTAGERKPAALAAAKRVYSGKGTTATITLAPGQSRWFVVVAYDLVGNASTPASLHVAIAAASKFGPAPRARVHGRVTLTWPRAKGAKYYNVQVYAGKKRIFVSWPSGRALKLPRAKLKRGTKYTWYVWPGIGAKAKAHYGKLIGRNAFTFTG